MINNLIFIALVVLAVTEVIFVVAIVKLGGKLTELNRIYDFVHEIMKTDSEMLDRIQNGISEEAETYEKMYNLIDTLGEQYKTIISSYEQILEAYTIMSNGYKNIDTNYKTLLRCWKDVADNYDTACTQFNLCTEEMRKFRKTIDPWYTDSDTLGQQMIEGFEDNDNENPFLNDDAV